MAVGTKDLNAVNDEINLLVPADRLAVAGIQYHAGGTGTVILEGTINETTWFAIEIRSIGASATTATSITSSGIWYADVSYLKRVRARKSATVSTCNVSLIINHN